MATKITPDFDSLPDDSKREINWLISRIANADSSFADDYNGDWRKVIDMKVAFIRTMLSLASIMHQRELALAFSNYEKDLNRTEAIITLGEESLHPLNPI